MQLHGCMLATLDEFIELVGLISQGLVRPLIHKTFPLKELVQAQAHALKDLDMI